MSCSVIFIRKEKKNANAILVSILRCLLILDPYFYGSYFQIPTTFTTDFE